MTNFEEYARGIFPKLVANIRLPLLEQFEMRDVDNLKGDDVAEFIFAHRRTLKSVELHRLMFVDMRTTEHGEWKLVLQAAKSLKSDATVHVSRAKVNIPTSEVEFLDGWYADVVWVCFTSPNDDEQAGTVQVVMKEGPNTDQGLHYFTEPGNLQKSLDCMIRSYKELLTWKDVGENGALGKVITLEEDSEDDEEDDGEVVPFIFLEDPFEGDELYQDFAQFLRTL